jgi:hypothetical protein
MRAVVDWSYGLRREAEHSTAEAAAAVTMGFFCLALRPSELSRRGPENVTKMTG